MILTHKRNGPVGFLSATTIAATMVLSFLGLTALFIPAVVHADPAVTHIVTTLADHDDGSCDMDCTLREAVHYSSEGDTITFDTGLTGSVPVGFDGSDILVDHSLTITGPGETALTLSGRNNNRIFDVTGGATLTLSGMTLANGYDQGDAGGAIAVTWGSLYATDVAFRGNWADDVGGAIYHGDNELHLVNASFIGNHAEGNGGAIFDEGELAVVQDTVFSGNRAGGYGGAINHAYGMMNISGSSTLFSGNTASYYGGAIESSAEASVGVGELHIEDATFRANSSNGPGGAISQEYGLLYATSTVFTGNSALDDASGGAVYLNGDAGTFASSTFDGNVVMGSAGGGAVSVCVNGTATFDGSVFQGNSSKNNGWAGAIEVNCASNLTIRGTDHPSRFIGNTAENGAGAIGFDAIGSMDISHAIFTENVATDGEGGAISSYGPANISDTEFTHNMISNGYAGGALYFDGSYLDVERTMFRENTVPGSGNAGAILLCGSGAITSSTFINNTASTGYGGAVQQVCGGDMVVTQSTFSGNTASLGGALDLDSGGSAVVTNSTFFQNALVAGGQGAAIRSAASTTLTNVTLAQNTGGASLYSNGGIMRVGNTIIQGAEGLSCDMGEGGMWWSSMGHNIASDTSCISGAPSDMASTDAKLDPRGLQDHGGDTQTIALLSTSPAIDAGDDAWGVAEDQRGIARPSGDHVDIGAYESDSVVSAPAGVSADILVTTLEDRDNEGCAVGDCSLREAILYSGAGASISFAPGLTGVLSIGSGVSIDHDLTIIGPGSNTLTVTGLSMGSLFYVDPGASVVISGLTFSSANAIDDGGVIQNSGSLTVTDSVFRNNATMGDGGAIADYGDALVVRGDTFVGNQGDNIGGGIYAGGTAFTSVSSTFTGNTGSAVGGGVFAESGSVAIQGSGFYGNGSYFSGAGIFSVTDANVSITSSAFGANLALVGGGGAIYQDAGDMDISNSSFTGNAMASGVGGAIQTEGNSVHLTNSAFTGNASGDNGGAVSYCTQSMAVTGSSFYDNHAMGDGNGGGLAVTCPSITTVTGSVFSGNNSAYRGGGMYLQTDDAPLDSITRTTFSGNQSINDNGGALNHSGTGDLALSEDVFQDNVEVNGFYGGAIFAEGETFHADKTSFERNVGRNDGGGAIILNAKAFIDHSSFLDNVAVSQHGGAINNVNSYPIDVKNSTFAGNVGMIGGAIYSASASVNTQNSTFSQNTAWNEGAALALSGGTANTFSDTFTQNTGVAGITVFGSLNTKNSIFAGGVASNCDIGEGSIVSLGNNIATIDDSCNLTGPNDQQEVTMPVLSAEGLRDNGGPTLTVALASPSLAVDTGSAQCPALDQRGTPRPQGSVCDIGAFESTTATPFATSTPDTYTVTTLEDRDNATCLPGDCSFREAVLYSSEGNTVNFAEGLTGTINLTSTITIDHSVTIEGPGSQRISISGQGSYQPFYIDPETVVTMSGMTIMNGYDNDMDGGLIYSYGNLSLSHMVLQGGYAEGYAGAIASYGTSLSLNDVTVSGNRSSSGGGAIDMESEFFSVASSTFSGNVSDEYGGAIYITSGDVEISGSSFSTNQSYYSGGAIYIDSADNVVVTSTTFTANKTDGSGNGGAIAHESGRLTVSNSSFDGNFTKGGGSNYGGAIFGEGTQLVVASSTFTGNVSTNSHGGAIFACQDTTIDGSVFTGNTALYGYGGAIFQSTCGTSLAISGSTFQANASGDDGGAVYGEGYGMTIATSTFLNNAAQDGYGGAVYQASNTLEVSDTLFSGNVSGENGGALYLVGDYGTIVRSTFEKNAAPSGGVGGAVHACEVMNIRDTVFRDNTASDNVGGALSQECGRLDVANSLFSGNTGWVGGAVFITTSDASSLANTTFFQNVAHIDGGAIWSTGNVLLTNDTFAENAGQSTLYAQEGALKLKNSIVNDGPSACAIGMGSLTSLGHNLDAGESCSFGILGDMSDANSGLDPRGPQSHGGYTPTIALVDGSAAIDAGTNAGCGPADARGVTRPQGDTCDIGAFEHDASYEAPAALEGDMTVTTLEDRDNGECVEGDCSLFEAVNYSEPGAVITFAAGLTGVIPTEGMTVDHSLTIRNSTPNAVTISGMGSATIFTGDPDVTLTIEGMTLAAGDGTWGGAINADGTNVIISTSTFRGNYGNQNGGAIAQAGEVFSMTDSVLSGNYADNHAGALYMDGGASGATVTGSSFIGNYADTHGGAIRHDAASNVVVTSSEFIANKSGSIGGAIFDQSEGGMTVKGSVFGANVSSNSGGAIDFWWGPGVIEDTVFTGNRSLNSNGGAVIADENIRLDISGTTSFVGNSSSYNGGALTLCTNATTIDGASFIANNDLGEGGGGAIGLYCGDLTVTGYDRPSVFRDNMTWGAGGAITLSAGQDTVIYNTDFSGNSSLNWTGGAVSSDSGSVDILDTSFEKNSSGSGGGAVNLEGDSATYHIRRTSFTDNASTNGGGALALAGGEATLEAVSFTGNTVKQGNGGAIYASRSFDLDGGYFGNNDAPTGAGGAIWFTTGDGSATIANATFFQNASAGAGGAILSSAPMGVYSLTVAQNSGYVESGSIEASDAITTVASSIITDVKGCAASGTEGALLSTGYNRMVTGTTCAFSGAGDVTGDDIRLDPSGPVDHSGFTPTIGLSEDSSAIDTDTAGWCSEIDQRGRFRPVNAACDIGAYEKDVLSPATPPGAVTGLESSSPDTTISLSWGGVESYGNAVIYDYLIQYRVHGSGEWIRYNHVPTYDQSMVLTGFAPSTQYDIRVSAINYAGIGSPSVTTVTTGAGEGGSAPAVPGLDFLEVISPRTYRLVWTTDQESSSWVDYGLTAEYTSSTEEQDISPRVMYHQVTLTGLTPCTLYHVQLHSRNADGLTGSSGDITFTTGGCDNVAISDVLATPGNTTATITWATSEALGSSRVIYGPNTDYESRTAELDISPRVHDHVVELTDLIPCVKYHYKVASTVPFFNTSTSTDATFSTTGCVGGAAPSSSTSTSINTAEGGVTGLTKEDGHALHVTFPGGFTSTSSEVEIQIHALDGSDVLGVIGKPSSSLTGTGDIAFDVKALIDSTTLLDSFDAPVTIVYHYLDSDISGLDESTLWMYHYHDGAWVALSDCVVNAEANTITCHAPNFSIFAMFGAPPIAPSAGSGGGGGGGGGSGAIYGCTDKTATNYNPSATIMSYAGQCQYRTVVVNTGSSTGSSVAMPTSSSMSSVTSISNASLTQLSCTAPFVLKKPVKYGAKNDPADVKTLIKYLNTYEGTTLPVTGTYSKDARDAVIRWQEKYAKEILAPWGLKKGTGYVFTESLKKMRQLRDKACTSSTPSQAPASAKQVFPRTLKLSDQGDDVKQLQIFLNTHGFPLATKGTGSPGKENTAYGPLVAKALARFQEAHAEELLKPAKLKKGTGAFGEATRKMVNQLLGQ